MPKPCGVPTHAPSSSTLSFVRARFRGQLYLQGDHTRCVVAVLGPLDLFPADWTLGLTLPWFASLVFSRDQSFHEAGMAEQMAFARSKQKRQR